MNSIREKCWVAGLLATSAVIGFVTFHNQGVKTGHFYVSAKTLSDKGAGGLNHNVEMKFVTAERVPAVKFSVGKGVHQKLLPPAEAESAGFGFEEIQSPNDKFYSGFGAPAPSSDPRHPLFGRMAFTRTPNEDLSVQPEGEYIVQGQLQGGTLSLCLGPDQRWLDLPRLRPVREDGQGYEVSWEPVPNALGYELWAVNAGGNEHVYWNSSPRNWQELGTTEEAVKQGVLLKETHCEIPRGMFSGPWKLSLSAISRSVGTPGDLSVLGWAESTVDVIVTK